MTRSTSQNCAQVGDEKQLEAIAAVHGQLVLANQTSEAILTLTATAIDRKDFVANLSQMAVQITVREATQDDLVELARLNALFNAVQTTMENRYGKNYEAAIPKNQVLVEVSI